MSRRTVVVADPIHADGLARLGESHDVIALDADTAGPEVARALSIADAIIVRLFEVTAETAAAAPRLKVVAKHGVGTDNIDVAAMTARGIVVANTPGANATAVAEMAVALMLGLVKRVADLDRAVRGGRFFEARKEMVLGDLDGTTLGLVGLGDIGNRVARICGAGFGMTVLAYDPYVDTEAVAALGGLPVADLRELLAASDIVSLHCPLSDATRHLIDADALAAMKPTALLVNTTRGAVIDETALAAALESGVIAGAALDAFETEPPEPDSTLLRLPNVLLSPHAGGNSEGALKRMAMAAIDNIESVLRGDRPDALVNPDVWDARGTNDEKA
jgi:D-3-phosphoglycerate dehydrogenase